MTKPSFDLTPLPPGELYSSLHGHVYRFAYSLLGRAPPADLVHDVCADIALAVPQFRGEAAFSSWVYAVVAHHLHKRMRAEHRRRCLMREAYASSLPTPATQPDDATGARRLVRRLGEALDRLPERQRTCLLMVQVDDLPTRAVAKRLGLTPDAVRMNVHRARSRLRRWLGTASS
jgi:RNA polymerase sigma-70 factor (ECF subfamily)